MIITIFIFQSVSFSHSYDLLPLQPNYQNPLQVYQNEYRVEQYLTNFTFYYQTQLDDQNKFLSLIVKLITSEDQNILPQLDFMYCIGQPCLQQDIKSNSNRDFNSFALNKYKASLLVGPLQDYEQSIYITLLIPEDQSYVYDLKIQSYQQKPCPCQHRFQGICYQDGKCVCQVGYLDIDCSVEAQPIENNEISLNLQNQEIQYVYYEPAQQLSDDLQFQFSVMKGNQVEVYLQIENQGEVALPNEKYNKRVLSVKDEEKLVIKKNEVKQYGYRIERIIFGLVDKNENNSYLKIELKQEKEEQQQDDGLDISLFIVYFLLGVIIIVIGIYIILKLIRIKGQVHDQNQSQHQRFQHLEVYRKREKQRIVEKLNSIMKITKYDSIELPNRDKRQQLILDQFTFILELMNNVKDQCRISPCYHIFHSECIEQWFEKQRRCPMCRSDLEQKNFTTEEQNRTINSIFVNQQDLAFL